MNKRYERKENEDRIEYLLRLAGIKLEEKPDDLEWADIVQYCGFDCHYDSVRKALQPAEYGGYAIYKYVLDKLAHENITDDKILGEYEVQKIELQKEKNKIQTLRLDLNRIIRETSRTELLYEEFINTIKNMCNVPIPEFKPLLTQDTRKEYVLSFADVHTGKQFKSITNEYDIEIMYERFNNLLSEVVEIIEENNISHLTILALGDFIEGISLRIGQLTQLKIGMTQQTIKFMRFMVAWLNKLSEYVCITYYQAPFANHSQIRPFGTKANEFANEDMEKIIFAYIHDILESNERINVVECEDKHIIFKIFHYNIIACHGHDVKNPETFIKDISHKYRIFFDYAFFAHKHSGTLQTVGEGVSNNIDVIRVPSIMGSDDYADDLLVGSKAGATLIEFTEKQGKRKTYDIILN